MAGKEEYELSDDDYDFIDKYRRALGLGTFLVSLVGTLANAYVLWGFISTKPCTRGFYLMCCSKCISNLIVLSLFAIYFSPAITFEDDVLPLKFNIAFSQIVNFGAYSQGPLTQFGMAVNRFAVIVFPVEVRTIQRNYAAFTLAAFWLISAVWTIYGIITGCNEQFVVEDVIFEEDEMECVNDLYSNLTKFVGVLYAANTTLSVFTVVKIVRLNRSSRNQTTSHNSQPQKIARKLFFQNMVQDCTHLSDMILFMTVLDREIKVGTLFFFNMGTLISIHAADGFIMILFNRDAQPRLKRRNTAITVCSKIATPSSSRKH